MKRIFLILSLLASLSCFGQTEFTPFYYQRATLFDILPVDSTNIVFLGNSLTNGCEWHELLGMPEAVNRGISGDIVEGVEKRLGPVVNGHPKKIFMMIGVNDVSHHLTADSVATATLALIDHIRQATPETELYVQSCLPINTSYGRYKNIEGKDQIIRDINTMVKPEAEKRGAVWIELYEHFADENGHLRDDLTNDGLHLLGPGYVLWRELITPYLK